MRRNSGYAESEVAREAEADAVTVALVKRKRTVDPVVVVGDRRREAERADGAEADLGAPAEAPILARVVGEKRQGGVIPRAGDAAGNANRNAERQIPHDTKVGAIFMARIGLGVENLAATKDACIADHRRGDHTFVDGLSREAPAGIGT